MSLSITDFPSELLGRICSFVYASSIPPEKATLDPLIVYEPPHSYSALDDSLLSKPPTALPSAIPPGNWPESVSRKTLSNLCLVNHAWYGAAKPWLWRKLEVRLPRSWLALVAEIAWDYEEETVDMVMNQTIQATAELAASSKACHELADKLQKSILEDLHEEGPEDAIPIELLSPIPTRESSPRRLRPKSMSPARWKLVRTISNAIQDVLDRRDPGVYVPMPNDPRPGRHVYHLDFNHFRTIGMRRSVDEGVNSRFVTGDRLEAILKEMPNLIAFGATEYMDGALTLPVLTDLFLRGAPSRGRGRPSRGRAIVDPHDTEEEDRDRRRECKDLEAIDLTGCVSAVFVNALSEFVATHLHVEDLEEPIDYINHASRGRLHPQDPISIPGLQRLGLRGVKSIVPRILIPFVMAFPSLTHLDLSGTRATPELLAVLGQSPTVRLQSLGLARCIKLTSESIKDFLVSSPVTADLVDLNLYGDMTFSSCLTEEDLQEIFTSAPCFLSGNLRYLDLSSTPLTRQLLTDSAPTLPQLRSLGLSYILDIPLAAITSFVSSKAVNVEVLTLVGTSPELDCGMRVNNGLASRGSMRESTISLHAELIGPLCTPPFSFSLFNTAPAPPPTRVRVIELSNVMLNALGAGAASWKIIRSKGGRGWYVDSASGWIGEGEGAVLRRDLGHEHPLRNEMNKLADANGNVSSGVGWHARKMEILYGHGMFGREDGLYGAVSFAYQG